MKEDMLKLPLAKLKVGNDPILILGEYNMKNKNIELNSSYDTDDSFFHYLTSKQRENFKNLQQPYPLMMQPFLCF